METSLLLCFFPSLLPWASLGSSRRLDMQAQIPPSYHRTTCFLRHCHRSSSTGSQQQVSGRKKPVASVELLRTQVDGRLDIQPCFAGVGLVSALYARVITRLSFPAYETGQITEAAPRLPALVILSNISSRPHLHCTSERHLVA